MRRGPRCNGLRPKDDRQQPEVDQCTKRIRLRVTHMTRAGGVVESARIFAICFADGFWNSESEFTLDPRHMTRGRRD